MPRRLTHPAKQAEPELAHGKKCQAGKARTAGLAGSHGKLSSPNANISLQAEGAKLNAVHHVFRSMQVQWEGVK